MRQVMATWARTVPTDVLFAEKFGSLDLRNRMSLVENEYLELRKSADADLESGKINKEQHNTLYKNYEAQELQDKDMLRVTAERIRGIHGYTPDMTTNMAATFARDVQSIATVASLGRAALSSAIDAGGVAAMRWGLGNVFKNQYIPAIKAVAMLKPGQFNDEVRRQAREMGLAMETALTLMRYKLPDIVQGPGNPVSTSLSYTASRYMILNGLMPWTDAMKSWGVAAATRVFGDAASRVAKGVHTAEDIKRLADANIPLDIAAKIGEQYEKHAADNLNIGFKFANIDKWDDIEAREYFKMAMRREGDTIVMTPGVGSAPIWTSNAILAPIAQFKGFVFRSHEVMATSNMQNLNAKMLGAYMWAGALGSMAFAMQKINRGEELPDDPSEWIKNVSDLASISPLYSDINKQFSGATHGKLDAWQLAGIENPYMRASDQTQIQSVLGPAFGLVGNAINAGFDLSMGSGRGSNIHNIRKALPGQNHFLLWPLYDLGEAKVMSESGLKPTKKQQQMMDTWGF